MSDVIVSRVIDCDADPMIPWEDWRVEEHCRSGRFTWDPRKTALYLSDYQYGQERIKGHALRRELELQPTLNANVLDYLMRYPHLIPEEWKVNKEGNILYIFFWGTVYRNSGDVLYVPSLDFSVGCWRKGYFFLEFDWGCNSPAVLRTS